MPGRVLPSRNSREAPPPVETWVILSASLNLLTAATLSPPPTTVIAPRPVASATSLATASVPFAKASNSNTPTGPFHTIDFAVERTFLYSSTVLGPTSIAIRFSGMSTPSTASGFASGLNSAAPTWSTGRTIFTFFAAASLRSFFAVSIKSSSTRDLPTLWP